MTVLEKKDCEMLNTFQKPDASQDELAKAGKVFLLQLYHKWYTMQSQPVQLRYSLYIKQISKTSSTVQLYSFHPTSSAAKYHSLLASLAVQKWLGNEANPTDWAGKT